MIFIVGQQFDAFATYGQTFSKLTQRTVVKTCILLKYFQSLNRSMVIIKTMKRIIFFYLMYIL